MLRVGTLFLFWQYGKSPFPVFTGLHGLRRVAASTLWVTQLPGKVAVLDLPLSQPGSQVYESIWSGSTL